MEGTMFLSEVFTPNLIKVGLEAEDKEEAFEELVDVFCSVKNAASRDEILISLHEREKLMSTGIQTGIALPHGKMDALDELYGVVGISKKGIDYDALDGQPVYLIFMILVPKDTDKHLRVLKRLAELLSKPEFYKDMLAPKDSQSAFNTLKRYEDNLLAVD
jgi:PTS system fructose-specific IIC component/PTS system nitrogen regulatory IIA component